MMTPEEIQQAKDTVMSPKKLQLLGQQYEDEVPTCDFTNYALEEQAEITGKIMYKAGYDKALGQSVEMAEECELIGRKEVIEWLNKNYDFDDIRDKEAKEEWQTQLKDWGVK